MYAFMYDSIEYIYIYIYECIYIYIYIYNIWRYNEQLGSLIMNDS